MIRRVWLAPASSGARSPAAFGLAALSLVIACGGAAPSAAPARFASSFESPGAAAPATPEASSTVVSVVRFDDLGVRFAVPPGFHVVGDDDLAARIRASANPRLTAALQSRASQNKGVPLLTLSKEVARTGSDGLTITLIATRVPQDATPAELLAQQQAVMTENLEGFAVTEGPREHPQDGVPGLELSDVFTVHERATAQMEEGAARAAARVIHLQASLMRLHVRGGLAFTTTAVWPRTAPPERAVEARAMLDGVSFYDAQP